MENTVYLDFGDPESRARYFNGTSSKYCDVPSLGGYPKQGPTSGYYSQMPISGSFNQASQCSYSTKMEVDTVEKQDEGKGKAIQQGHRPYPGRYSPIPCTPPPSKRRSIVLVDPPRSSARRSRKEATQERLAKLGFFQIPDPPTPPSTPQGTKIWTEGNTLHIGIPEHGRGSIIRKSMWRSNPSRADLRDSAKVRKSRSSRHISAPARPAAPSPSDVANVTTQVSRMDLDAARAETESSKFGSGTKRAYNEVEVDAPDCRCRPGVHERDINRLSVSVKRMRVSNEPAECDGAEDAQGPL